MRYISRDPLAIRALVAAGLCVTIAPRVLAGELAGIAIVDLEDGPRRTVYTLLPDAGATPLARGFIAALAQPAVR